MNAAPEHDAKVPRQCTAGSGTDGALHNLVNHTSSSLIANILASTNPTEWWMDKEFQGTVSQSLRPEKKLKWWITKKKKKKNLGEGRRQKQRGVSDEALKCFSLLAVRYQHEIENVLETLGQDSNIQAQQSESGCRGKNNSQALTYRRWREA